ncbi:MAG TPA: hypothetical protein VGO10_11635 [Baekduia sp.]|nr:hypothetical protein [Baekduia sp.]
MLVDVACEQWQLVKDQEQSVLSGLEGRLDDLFESTTLSCPVQLHWANGDSGSLADLPRGAQQRSIEALEHARKRFCELIDGPVSLGAEADDGPALLASERLDEASEGGLAHASFPGQDHAL